MTIYRLGEGDLGGKEGTHKMTMFDRQTVDKHWGNPAWLGVRRNSFPAHYVTVMEWDISRIPTNIILASATLSFICSNNTALDAVISVHKMITPFVIGAIEDPATAGQSTYKWRAQPSLWNNGSNYIDGGGGTDWRVTPETTFNCYTADIDDVTKYNVDLSSLYDEQITISESILRIIMFYVTDTANWELQFHSQAAATEAYRPELTVVGELPETELNINHGNPVGYSNRYTNPFPESETVDISSTSHTFSRFVRGLLVTGTGNVIFHVVGDAEGSYITIPVAVESGHYHIIRPFMIDKVIRTGTTATVVKGLF